MTQHDKIRFQSHNLLLTILQQCYVVIEVKKQISLIECHQNEFFASLFFLDGH